MEPDEYREALVGSVFDQPVVWEYFGSRRYLQAAFSLSAAQSYARKFDTITSQKMSIFAAKSGSLTFLAWTKDIGCDWTKHVFMSAIKGGSIPCLEFILYGDGSPEVERSNVRIMKAAVKAGSIEVIEWLSERGFEWDQEHICSVAAKYGQLEALICLLGHGCASTGVYLCAAAFGRLNILNWMYANNHPITAGALLGAAQLGQIPVLEWIYERGGPFVETACAAAAFENRLSVLQWLRDHDGLGMHAQIIRL